MTEPKLKSRPTARTGRETIDQAERRSAGFRWPPKVHDLVPGAGTKFPASAIVYRTEYEAAFEHARSWYMRPTFRSERIQWIPARQVTTPANI